MLYMWPFILAEAEADVEDGEGNNKRTAEPRSFSLSLSSFLSQFLCFFDSCFPLSFPSQPACLGHVSKGSLVVDLVIEVNLEKNIVEFSSAFYLIVDLCM